MTDKYPRGKIKFHFDQLQRFLKMLKNQTYDVNIDELMELVQRCTPQKPNGEWIAGRDGYSCPRCPCCGSRVKSGTSSSSPVRDDHCRKCGQLIAW